jgi:Tfp pilus assembly protein PilX
MKLFKTNQKGIALLIALGTMIVILIIASLAVYLIVRGVNVTRGQVRYETVYEAAVAALEIGKAEAEILNSSVALPSITRVDTIGNYEAVIFITRAGEQTFAMPGAATKFARGTQPGAGGPTGYYRNFYVHAIVTGRSGEQAQLEAMQRFVFSP